jgi:formate-dependent nitrite reductase membrane component NrfD
MVAALLLGLSGSAFNSPGGRFMLTIMAPAAALLFTAVTTLLLITDLHRPERFYYILLKPNPRSWLVVGTWILIVYSIWAMVWLAFGIWSSGGVPLPIIVAAAIAAASSAGYSAFLFAQAKGRDLWQSPLFLWHLLVQAIMAGAALVILLAVVDDYAHITNAIGGGRGIIRAGNILLLAAVVLNILMVLAELALTPYSADVDYAAELILHGSLSRAFWFGVVGLGSIVPAVLLAYVLAAGLVSVLLEVVPALLSLAGLLIFEKLWIDAGQAPPLS